MASPAPAKSQPLHNFSLPLLKWSKNHSSNHHRGRRPSDSPPPPDSVLRNSPSSEMPPARRPSPLLDSARRLDSVKRQSPMRDSASETESGYGSDRKKKLAAESSRISLFVSPPRDQPIERPPAIPQSDVAAVRENRSPKIYFRFPKTAKAPDTVQEKPKSSNTVPEKPKSADFVVPEEPKKVSDEGKKLPVAMEFDELEGKTWNLRPRKPLHKKSNGGTSKTGGGAGGGAPPQEAKSQAAANRPEANSSRGGGGVQAPPAEKDKKPKFSVSLTKQEIEDDILRMTGAKPNRRPKKRSKNVQRQLDNLYPGLWLVNVTPDLYKVPESTPKAKTPK